jgi:hypothetical protein
MTTEYTFQTPAPTTTPAIKQRAKRVRDMKPIARPPVVDGFIHRGDYGVLYGPPNCGKSAMMMSLTACVAAGRPWSGRETHKGCVVLVGTEGADYHPARLSAAEKAFQIDPSQSAPVIFYDHDVDLREEQAVTDLIAAVRAKAEEDGYDHIAAVFVDTLSSCIGDADQNSAADSEQVNRAVKRIRQDLGQPAAILIHHTGANTKDDKPTKKERGSNAIRGAADWMIRLEDKADRSIKTAASKQPRNGAQLPVFHMVKETREVACREALSGNEALTDIVCAIPLSEQKSVTTYTGDNENEDVTDPDVWFSNLDLSKVRGNKIHGASDVANIVYDLLADFGSEGLHHNELCKRAGYSPTKMKTIKKELAENDMIWIEQRGHKKFFVAKPIELIGRADASEQSDASTSSAPVN